MLPRHPEAPRSGDERLRRPAHEDEVRIPRGDDIFGEFSGELGAVDEEVPAKLLIEGGGVLMNDRRGGDEADITEAEACSSASIDSQSCTHRFYIRNVEILRLVINVDVSIGLINMNLHEIGGRYEQEKGKHNNHMSGEIKLN